MKKIIGKLDAIWINVDQVRNLNDNGRGGICARWNNVKIEFRDLPVARFDWMKGV